MHKLLSKTTLLVLAFFACLTSLSAQDYYVGHATLVGPSGNEGKTYHYTKSVTLGNGFVADGDNGTFIITPIAVNPPPSPEQNYVRVEVPKEEVSSEADLTNFTADQKAVSYSYSDGLGRATMSSAAEAGPLYEDLVQHVEYDDNGDEKESYLRYAKAYTDPGAFIANSKVQTTDFYNITPPAGIESDSNPFGYVQYDDRGRMASARPPGENWVSPDKETIYDYFVHKVGTNPDGNYRVLHWIIDNDEPENDGDYAAKELSVVMTTDPQGNIVRTVKDMRGLTITTQVKDGTDWYGSYNVYDDFGRLRFVIPPIIAANLDTSFPNNLSTTQIDELLFQYEYDERGRVKQEKAPGTGWTFYVYDQWDRMVMSRYQGQVWEGDSSWTFYKYDALNRQVMTGQIKTEDSRSGVISKISASEDRYESTTNNSEGYTLSNSFPKLGPGGSNDYSNFDILTIKYYDNHNFKSYTGWSEDVTATTFDRVLPTGFSGTQLSNALNLTTGSKVRILDATGGNQWLNTVIYYDDDGRIQQTVAENHIGGIDRLTNQYEWDGELTKMLVEHSSSTDAVDILSEYEYAHNGQLLETYQTIDGGTRVLVARNHYNVMGQLIEKDLHSTNNGSSFLQAVNYEYNIQGSLTAINDPSNLGTDVFGMKFHYEASSPVSGANARHDGLLNSVTWNARVATGQTGPNGNTQQGLGFNYDDRKRLSATKSAEDTNNDGFDDNKDRFNMTAGYDDNGNIADLTRKSEGNEIDDLDYHYGSNSNKLVKVDDLSNEEDGFNNFNDGMQVNNSIEYDYDPNTGNMEFDAHKEMAIAYNHLHLMKEITFIDVDDNDNVLTSIEYAYDAVGNKLSKTIIDEDGNTIAKVDYVGIVEYLDGEINQVFMDEGRAYKQNNTYHYEYFLMDHQANNRVAFGNLPERYVYVATMETSNETSENSEFAFPSGIRSGDHNHTPLGGESVKLNGTVNGKEVGPAKVLQIASGDEVKIDVWAKYTDGGWNNTSITDIVSVLTTAFGVTSSGTGAESASSSYTSALNLGSVGVFAGNTTGQPEAYLQYMFFNANHQYVASTSVSNFKPVTNASNGSFAELSSGKLSFNEPGYLLVYVVNESNQNKNVFFDDLRITHSSSQTSFRVTQINDYYPFGLPTSNSWRAPGYIDPGLLYQSSYASYDSLTGYYDFLSRSYDPVLGRWFQVDPAGQFSSPYNGMGNMPHMTVDPNGELAWFVPIIIGAAIGGTAGGIQSANNGGTFLGGFWKGALIGGAAAATGIGASAWASGSAFTAVGAGTASVGFGGVVAGGAAGGFVSGSANAWMNGASFGAGLGAGFKGAALGGATAGGLYGLSKGFEALGRNGANKIIDESREVAYASNGGGGVNPEYKINNITGKIEKIAGAGHRGANQANIYHVGSPGSNGGWSGTLRYSFGKNNIDVFRFYQSAASTISAFNVPTSGLTGFFLERPGPDSNIKGSKLRIPEGQYALGNHWREFVGGKYTLQNPDLLGNRDAILIHRGNYPSNSKGCLLTGCSWKPDYVGGNYPYNSGYKLNELHRSIEGMIFKRIRVNIFNTF